jgi:hypothetical protein
VGRPDATMCLNCVRRSEKARRPRFEGGARTEFGTRVAKAITCTRCGKEDYIAFKPKDPAKVMCKKCTAEVAGLDEHGDPLKKRFDEVVCDQCGRTHRIPVARKRKSPRDDDPVLCPDCRHGIESVQGTKTLTGERRRSGIILKRKGPSADIP